MKDLAKGVPRWVHGVFVGKTEGSDEHIVLTPVGAQTFRTVRRLPESSRHSLHSLESVAGLPWDTKGRQLQSTASDSGKQTRCRVRTCATPCTCTRASGPKRGRETGRAR